MLSRFNHTVLMRKDRPASARDAALLKLSRVNRWVIAGSVALTALLSEVAAQAFPGKTVNASAAAKTGQAQTRASKSSGGSSTTSPGALQPPAQAPQAAPESAPQESAPAQEPTESAPAQEPRESAPAQESTPAQPAQEAAPSQESAPTVSGGS
jgi:hypothetical protein